MEIDHQRIRKAVLKQITEHPESHNQYGWSQNFNKRWETELGLGLEPDEHIRKYGCGTTACVGGWSIFYATPEELKLAGNGSIKFQAQTLLGINDVDAADYLFYCSTEEEAIDYLRLLIGINDPVGYP